MSAHKALGRLAKVAFTIGIGISVINASLYTVDGGHGAILFDRFRGVLDQSVGEGTHFLIPWLQKPYIFELRLKPYNISTITGTEDLQMVHLSLRMLSRPNVAGLLNIFQRLGLDYDERVLPSIGNEVVKAVVVQFNADQLLTERPYVSAIVKESMSVV